MGAEQYKRMTAWFRARPAALAAVGLAGRGAVALVYLLYLGLLAALAARRDARFWGAVVVPAAALVLGTALRAAIDRPRPYAALGFEPLFPKKKTGQSMPSRHAFSAAAIAVTALYIWPLLGAVLVFLAVCIAVTRVLWGVHYPSDVAVGLAFGALGAAVGVQALQLCGWF